MLEPLGGFLAFGPQTCALGAAHLIHRLIQMARDMEPIQHVQSLPGLGRDDLQMASSPFASEWRGANYAEESGRTPVFAGARPRLPRDNQAARQSESSQAINSTSRFQRGGLE